MIDNFKNISDAYSVITEGSLSELKAYGGLLKHKKSGARLVILSCEDNNKVFNIGFRTPPKDSTGVAHILEHSVLCGSREFPAKDPFVELVKGSLNTFLNAMTYPDKTVYPVASCNDKDFQNLMHVYLDAVFYPNIYSHKEIFMQEGWHYELESLDSPLTYNGVVYNEMKGVFSSPEQLLYRKITDTLFPNTPYGVESGGDPAFIPDLTYEEFLNFHSTYYHPSNSYIYLYGDMDVYEKLEFLDKEYLRNFDAIQVDSEIPMEKPFASMKVVESSYSISDTEPLEDNTYMSFNVVLGDSLDRELYVAFQILDAVLMSSPGAPLKKALIDEGVGRDIFSSYENGILQPYMSFIVKNSNAEQRDRFLSVMRSTLQELIKEGLNKKSLKGAINHLEFKYREGDFGRYPAGLMYGLQMLDSWLYDEEKPFIHVQADDTFAFLKKMADTDYFEKLIEKYILNNNHASLLILKPEKGLTIAMEKETQARLSAYKDSLSKEELEEIIENTKKLKLYQDTPSTKEELEKIPMLRLDDIERKAEPLCNEVVDYEGIRFVSHPLETRGIGYLKLLFNMDAVACEDIPYVSLLGAVLGNVDTENFTYSQLSDEVNMYTGGMKVDTVVYNMAREQDYFMPKFEISSKAFFEHTDKIFMIVRELIFTSHLEDKKRLKEVIAHLKSRLQMAMVSGGHTVAVNRATSYFSMSSKYKELLSGVDFYKFIEDLDKNFDQKADEIILKLQYNVHIIFRKENLMVDYTALDGGFEEIKKETIALAESLYTDHVNVQEREDLESGLRERMTRAKNEGFITAGMVQYDATAGNFASKGYKYTGALSVLKVILGYDYLWLNVRVKGGAYGCMCGFASTGNAYFTSYRDPNLKETFDVYEGAAKYLETFDVDDRDMAKYIIGAVSSVDVPLNPAAKGARSLTAYLNGTTYEEIQESRDELLNANVETIRSLSKIVRAFVEDKNICVVGSETQIEKHKDMFDSVEMLFN